MSMDHSEERSIEEQAEELAHVNHEGLAETSSGSDETAESPQQIEVGAAAEEISMPAESIASVEHGDSTESDEAVGELQVADVTADEDKADEKPKRKASKPKKPRSKKEVVAEDEEDEGGVAVASDEGDDGMAWYALKVQSNREKTVRDAILRRIKINEMEDRVSDVLVPTEKVTEMKGGKKRVMEKKFYPGYIIMRLALDQEVWVVIRETPGVGDFVSAGGKPVAMSNEDVERMLGRKEKAAEEKQPRLQISFEKGDRVKIKEGAFENFEGEVDEVIEGKGLVRVIVQVFNRPTPVELEYWQVEAI